jgi:hypothetical protein
MSGALSSIFSGQPTPAQPTESDTQTNSPLWMQQYLANIANAATNLAGTQYTPFPGPTVASPSAATQQSWQMALNNVGSYQPDLTQAQNLIQQGSAPLTAASINSYMSPYMGDVVGALQSASNTNFQQNQMPAISSQFVGAGQAASPQMAQADNNALYQNNQALDQAVSGALQSGYTQATQTAEQQQQNALTAGSQYGQLGALQSQLGALDVGQVAAAGAGQDTYNQSNINAALNNFYAQQQWPYQNLAYASNIIRGQNVPSNTMTVGTQYTPNTSYTASPLSAFVGTTLGAASLGSNNNSSSSSNSNSSSGLSSLFSGSGGQARGGHIRPKGALQHFKRAA